MINKSVIISKNNITSKQLENWIAQQMPQPKIAGKPNNTIQAIELLKQKQPRLAFINLQDLTTEDFLQLQQMKDQICSVVFIPPGFTKEKFTLPQNMFNQKFTKPNSLKLKIDRETKHISFSKIVRLKACSNYTYIYTTEKEQPIFSSKTLKFYADQLGNETFVRPHHSHLTNRNFIKELILKPKPYLLLKDDTKISISRRRLKAFKELGF